MTSLQNRINLLKDAYNLKEAHIKQNASAQEEVERSHYEDQFTQMAYKT